MCHSQWHPQVLGGSTTSGRLGKELGEHEAGDPITQSNIPVQVTGLDSQITAISAGSQHTCAIHNGAAKCWGFGFNGRLGKELGEDEFGDPITQSSIPVDVTGLDSDVTAISAGSFHTCAIHAHAAKCWGSNANGTAG